MLVRLDTLHYLSVFGKVFLQVVIAKMEPLLIFPNAFIEPTVD